MPKGDKGKYTDKQKRKAEHIAEGYEDNAKPGPLGHLLHLIENHSRSRRVEVLREGFVTTTKETFRRKRSGT